MNALSVRTSQTDGFPLRGADGSSTVSMRCHGMPCRQNVRRCIRVAVVDRAALRARPFPHAQRQCLNDMPAVGAGLRGWKPAVDFDHGLAGPLGLLFDHADRRSDATKQSGVRVNEGGSSEVARSQAPSKMIATSAQGDSTPMIFHHRGCRAPGGMTVRQGVDDRDGQTVADDLDVEW